MVIGSEIGLGARVFTTLMGLMLAWSQDVSASQEEVAAKVLNLKGSVFLMRSSARSPLDATTKIFAGDTVVTESNGRVKLLLSEGNNEVVVGASTRLLIERVGSISRSKSGTTLSLKEGKVRSVVKRKYSGEGSDVFEIKTANAVAGVRGTEFIVSFDRASARSVVATLSGAVMMKGAGSEILVARGMFSSLLGRNLEAPRSMKSDPEVLQEIKSLSEDQETLETDKEKVDMDLNASAGKDSGESPKQEVFFDSDGNEVLVQKDVSSDSSRSPASVGSAGPAAAAPNPSAAPRGTLNSGVSGNPQTLPSNLVNVAPPQTQLAPSSTGAVPGLNAAGAQNLTTLVNQNAGALSPAKVSVPIE